MSAHFEMAEALERLGGDRQLLAMILEMFMRDLPKMINDIRGPLTAQDPKQVQETAHALKGAALNCATPELADLALKLESQGRAKNLAESPETFTLLEAEFQQLQTILANTIQELKT